jgi:RNA polymerase sigma factor FliA
MATQLFVPNVNPSGRFSMRVGCIENRRADASAQGERHRRVEPGNAGNSCEDVAKADRERQVLDLIPLVKRMALKMRRTLPAHIELDDLVGAGMLGLLDATQKYDSRKRVKIESYARHRIRGAILDGLRSLDTASRDLRKKNKRIEKAFRDLETRLGRAAEEDEAARELGISLEKWHRDLQELRAAGVNGPHATQAKNAKLVNEENLPAENQLNQYELCYLRERRDIANRALACLPARERSIVSLYHGREMTMKEIGSRLRIDESRVSQLHSAAVERLRLTVKAIVSRPMADSALQPNLSSLQVLD